MEADNNKPLTPQEIYHREIHCPSCGRFVGTFDRCPYCQALVQKRLSLRVFKILAVLTSTVGLLLLLFFARNITTPLVEIKELGPLSNFAHVRLEGVVARSYGVHPEWHSLSFTLEQPGNSAAQPQSIRIQAYAKIALQIEKLQLVPNEGDQISVEGQVRFQKDTPSLLINAPEHLKILRRASPVADFSKPLNADGVTKNMIGKVITVKGCIAELLTFTGGTLIKLEDGKSGFGVWIPIRTWEDMKLSVHDGDTIQAAGKVKPFKDSLEIEVMSPDKIQLLGSGNGNKTGAIKTQNESRPKTGNSPETNVPTIATGSNSAENSK